MDIKSLLPLMMNGGADDGNKRQMLMSALMGDKSPDIAELVKTMGGGNSKDAMTTALLNMASNKKNTEPLTLLTKIAPPAILGGMLKYLSTQTSR